jgi:hypothetical protein
MYSVFIISLLLCVYAWTIVLSGEYGGIEEAGGSYWNIINYGGLLAGHLPWLYVTFMAV